MLAERRQRTAMEEFTTAAAADGWQMTFPQEYSM